MTEGAGSTYFRRASLSWIMVIIFLTGFFTWTVFWPSHIPFQNLGPAGSFIKYLVDYHYKWLYWGFWVALGIHIVEAFYAFKLCSVKGITNWRVRTQWVLQTLLFGLASLSLLLSYKPGQMKKRR